MTKPLVKHFSAFSESAIDGEVVLLNLPNLGGAPYLARNSALERGVMQRIAVGMSERVNAQAGPNTFVVDLLCDARILEASSFSSDGFHPSDRATTMCTPSRWTRSGRPEKRSRSWPPPIRRIPATARSPTSSSRTRSRRTDRCCWAAG